MITRRGLFGLLGGFAAAEVAWKIYVLPPMGGWRVNPGEAMFYLPEKDWKYKYAYRNIITGHVSDATPHIQQLVHTFAWPESDVVDIYKTISDGSLELHRTMEIRGFKG